MKKKRISSKEQALSFLGCEDLMKSLSVLRVHADRLPRFFSRKRYSGRTGINFDETKNEHSLRYEISLITFSAVTGEITLLVRDFKTGWQLYYNFTE